MTSHDTYHAFMLDYAAGNLSPSMQVAANIHRLMSSSGDDAAQLWESVRAALSVTDRGMEVRHPHEDRMGAAVEIIHMDYDDVNWRRGLSGVKYARTPATAGQLMRLEPGQKVFSHGHSALEATVVLEGTLDDGNGTYEQGDILLAEPGLKHRPAAFGNAACTCFVSRSPKPFWRLT